MAQVEALLFDNDGTLVDTHDLILNSFRHTVKQVLGKDLPEEQLLAKVGQPLSVQMWDLSPDPQVHDELCRVYREHNHRTHDESIKGFPGVAETLAQLKASGYKMGVVTSKMHKLAAHGLEVLGILDYFDVLIGADDCPLYKPDPTPIIFGAEQLGFAPDHCAYIGDSPFDMQAGNGAGCLTIAALWGMFSKSRLLAAHPDLLCSSFPELPEVLKDNQE